MEAITLLIAVAALIIAILAYQRTGGTAELKRRFESKTSLDLKQEMDTLVTMTDALREKTADASDRLEKVIRKTERTKHKTRFIEDIFFLLAIIHIKRR
jgi:hypothetical protein